MFARVQRLFLVRFYRLFSLSLNILVSKLLFCRYIIVFQFLSCFCDMKIEVKCLLASANIIIFLLKMNIFTRIVRKLTIDILI